MRLTRGQKDHLAGRDRVRGLADGDLEDAVKVLHQGRELDGVGTDRLPGVHGEEDDLAAVGLVEGAETKRLTFLT